MAASYPSGGELSREEAETYDSSGGNDYVYPDEEVEDTSREPDED
jgi:hypothetical protein